MSGEARSWLREPLLHFILLGALLFALDARLRAHRVEAGRVRGDEILVTTGRIENLLALYTKTWQRAPSPDEMRGLIRDHVLEEALYREALSLGLDRDDVIIRRRLRQKMEFMLEDIVELAEPSEADLAAWLTEHPEAYAESGRCSFRQVYLNPAREEAALHAQVESLLAELRSATPEEARELGDATLLSHANGGLRSDEIERAFGPEFRAALAQLPAGQWGGPLESPYGLHLVIVDAREPGRAPELSEVRDAVARDWSFQQREDAQRRFNEELLERYTVTIAWPEDLVPAPE